MRRIDHCALSGAIYYSPFSNNAIAFVTLFVVQFANLKEVDKLKGKLQRNSNVYQISFNICMCRAPSFSL